jgi:hypothetical protein
LFSGKIGEGVKNKQRIKRELLDELLKDYKSPEDILGEQGLLKQFTKSILERALGAELTRHLGYERHDPTGYGSGNSRNGRPNTKNLTRPPVVLSIEDPSASGYSNFKYVGWLVRGILQARDVIAQYLPPLF